MLLPLPILKPTRQRYSFWKEELDRPLQRSKRNLTNVATQTEDFEQQKAHSGLTDSGYSDVPSKKCFSSSALKQSTHGSTTASEPSGRDLKKKISQLKSKIEFLKLRSKSAMCTMMTNRLQTLHDQIVIAQ